MTYDPIINLQEYDSSKYLSILESIKHGKDNILAKHNREAGFIIERFLIIPYDIINKEIIPLLSHYILSEPLDKMYHMNPQLYAYDKYLCTDLWDIILKINNCYSCEDFTMERVNFLTEEGLQELFMFLQNVKKKNLKFKYINIEDNTVYKLKY